MPGEITVNSVPLKSSPRNAGAPAVQRGGRDFDSWIFSHDGASTVRPASVEELPDLWGAACAATNTVLAAPSVVARVMAHDPESVWVVEYDGRVIGGYALLYLSREGVRRLQQGKLNAADPALECLAAPDEPPEGIYHWVGFKSDAQASGLGRVLEMLHGPRFLSADLWGVPCTTNGRRFAESMGMRPFPCLTPNLYRYVRRANRPVHPGV